MEQQPLYKVLPLDYHPQQIEKKFKDFTISSKFDSGNLQSINQLREDTVRKLIIVDCINNKS
jgi:hypothetical protein